ncbi:MAG: cyclic pyranopterin monophosphate synthase MoaC [Thermoanaerobaculia bacterium]
MNRSRKRQPAELSHLDADGNLSMVDVGAKPVSRREAVASARVRLSRETIELLQRKALPKGDVLAVAKVAGILAAKRTPSLIPLTHLLPLDSIDVSFAVDDAAGVIAVEATVRCEARTGVEIEAMTACSVAALTIYDMCKSVEKGIVIERIQLERKSGGKSGEYRRPND